MNAADFTLDESLWWLFSVAELYGPPPRGCLRVIVLGAPYGLSTVLPCDWFRPVAPVQGELIYQGIFGLYAAANPGPTFGVMVAADLWPHLDMPWDERDPWDERPRMYPTDPEPFRSPAHPLAYAHVHGAPAWRNAWEEFFGHVAFSVAHITAARRAGRRPIGVDPHRSEKP